MFNYYWGEIRNGGLKSCRKKKTTIAQNCDEIKIKTDYKEIARSVWYTWPRKLNVEEKILFHCNALIEWFIKAFQTLLQQFDVFPFGWGKHCVCLERKRNPSLALLWKTCEQFYFALTTFEQCKDIHHRPGLSSTSQEKKLWTASVGHRGSPHIGQALRTSKCKRNPSLVLFWKTCEQF